MTNANQIERDRKMTGAETLDVARDAIWTIGAMVMLLPGLGESNIPVRVKLGIALLLTLVILPLHRAAYHIDMQSLTPLMVLMVHEIVIGVVLGATARVTLSALQVAGSVIAQQLGLGFVTAIDPTQGQQGLL